MFLYSYRNTCGSLEDLEITWKSTPYGLVFLLIISRSPKLPRVSLQLYRNTENVFYFLNRNTREFGRTTYNQSKRHHYHYLSINFTRSVVVQSVFVNVNGHIIITFLFLFIENFVLSSFLFILSSKLILLQFFSTNKRSRTIDFI